MVWTIIALLVALWVLGMIGHVGGALIHLLLAVAAIALIYRLTAGRRFAL